MITTNDSNAIAVNDQAALDLATQAEGFEFTSEVAADAADAALADANQHKATVDDFATTAAARLQEATDARALIATALADAELETDLTALQATQTVAIAASTALETARDAANAAYSSALELINGDLTSALALVETERRNTEIAMNGANNALSSATQYQANEA